MALVKWPDNIIIISQTIGQLFEKQVVISSDNGVDQIVNRADPAWRIAADLAANQQGSDTGDVEDLFNRLDGAKNVVDMPLKRNVLPDGSAWDIDAVSITEDDLTVTIDGVSSEEGMPKHKDFFQIVPPASVTDRSSRIFRVAEVPVFGGGSYKMILQPRLIGGVVAGDRIQSVKTIRVRRIVGDTEVWGTRNANWYEGASSRWKEVVA